MNLTNALAQALHLPDLSPLMLDESYAKGFQEARRLALIAADNFEPVKPLLAYQELTQDQQDSILKRHYHSFMQAVCEGAVEFTDPQITEGIERAHKKCEGMQTPWFIASYVQDEVGDLLMQIARTEVESAFYVNPDFEGVISPFNP